MLDSKEAVQINSLVTGEGGFRLLGGIVIDGKLEREVVLREMSGHEEDILTDQRRAAGGDGKLLKSGATRLSEVLARCTLRIGDKVCEANEDPETSKKGPFLQDWATAFTGDRLLAVVMLRRFSLGDSFTFDDVCPSCNSEIKHLKVDLGSLLVYPFFRNITGENAQQKRDELLLQRTRYVEKVSPKLSVEWNMPCGNDEDDLAEAMDRETDIHSAVLATKLRIINGAQSTPARVKALRAKDRDYLRQFLAQAEGGVDSIVEIECTRSKCRHKFSRNFNFAKQSFFFPSAV